MTSQAGTIILDGGMGRELEAMGAPFQQPEWSALTLMEAPDCVARAHDAFINAGAQVITTNAYAVVPFHIGEDRFQQRGEELARLAAEIARGCADKAAHKVQVAGCIPPLFGSYQPDLFAVEQASAIIAPLVQGQKDLVDVWLIETTSSLEEAAFALNYLQGHGGSKPIWIAFTLAHLYETTIRPHLRSGQPIAEIAAFAPQVEALLFNCAEPELMSPALDLLHDALGDNAGQLQLGVYANCFQLEKVQPVANEVISKLREEITPQRYLDFAKEWQDKGASILGGCCGIGPDHIKELSLNL